MSRAGVERKLSDVAAKIERARREKAILDEQWAVMQAEAEDLRIRALVSETPLANREYEEAHRHAETMRRSGAEVAESLQEYTTLQDELLTKWASEAS